MIDLSFSIFTYQHINNIYLIITTWPVTLSPIDEMVCFEEWTWYINLFHSLHTNMFKFT